MKYLIIIVLFAVIGGSSVLADKILHGRVIRVKDGDSFLMSSGGLTYEIRMYGIDAPELKQPYGKNSAQALRSYIVNKNIKVIKTGSDTYGRLIGKIYTGKNYINLAMVKNGHAHWYQKYAPKDKDLQSAEQNARKAKCGLWTQLHPILPSKWRKQKHRSDAQK